MWVWRPLDELTGSEQLCGRWSLTEVEEEHVRWRHFGYHLFYHHLVICINNSSFIWLKKSCFRVLHKSLNCVFGCLKLHTPKKGTIIPTGGVCRTRRHTVFALSSNVWTSVLIIFHLSCHTILSQTKTHKQCNKFDADSIVIYFWHHISLSNKKIKSNFFLLIATYCTNFLFVYHRVLLLKCTDTKEVNVFLG